MRIPIPERVAVKHVLLFAVALFLTELIEGTDLTFALLVFAYVLLFGLAFNAAGGVTYPSGAWIFFTGTLTCLVGLTYKAILGQPAESHLKAPLKTMGAYSLGMAGMALAAFVVTSLRPKRGLLADVAVDEKLHLASIGCLILGIAGTSLSFIPGLQTATFATAFAQLNHFGQMAVILATTYQITKSGGKNSTNWVVWVGVGFQFAVGVVVYSKEGMFVPVLAWLVPCTALRFNFSRRQIIGGILAAAFMIFYMVPYSQYGRQSRGDGMSIWVQLAFAEQYLLHLEDTRKAYLETSAETIDVSGQPHLYDKAEGLFDRVQMLTFDDALIDYTDNTSTIGLGPTANAFLNIIPHFISANKPTYADGNMYGREIGVISDEDTSTGISFSPVGDAYHQNAWVAVGVILPLIMLMMFLIADSLSGDVRRSPWGLLFIAMSAHLAPEGLLSGVVWMGTFGAEILIFVAIFSAYVLPKLVALFTGRERTRIRITQDFRFGVQNRQVAPILKKAAPESRTI
jgi:hypothetical protein